MNKAAVWLVGGVAVLGAVGVGSMAVIGQKTQARMTTEARAELEKWAPFVTVQELQYDKTFTGATRTLTLQIGCGEQKSSVVWRDTIQHGPLPGWNSFGAASVHSELVLNDEAKATLKNMFGLDAAPFTLHSLVGFGGSTTSDLAMPSFKTTLPEGSEVNWQGLTLRAKQNGKDMQFEAKIPGINLVSKAPNMTIELKDFNVRGNSQSSAYWWAMPGTATGELASFKVVAQEGSGQDVNFLLSGLKYKTNTSLDKDLLSTGLEMSAALDVNGKKIDKVVLQESMKRIHLPTLDSIISAVLNKDTAKEACTNSGSLEQILQARLEAAMEDMPAKLAQLLPHNPAYGIDKLAVTYEGKEGSVGYSVGVEGITADEAKPEALLANPKALIGKIVASAEARLPVAWIKLLSPGGANTDEDITNMLAPYVADGFIVRDGEYVTSKLAFKDSKATVNGKVVPVPGIDMFMK